MEMIPETWRAHRRFIVFALAAAAAGGLSAFFFDRTSHEGVLALVSVLSIFFTVFLLPVAAGLYLGAAPFAAAAGRFAEAPAAGSFRDRFLPSLILALFLPLPAALVNFLLGNDSPSYTYELLIVLALVACLHAAAALAGLLCRRVALSLLLAPFLLLTAPLLLLPLLAVLLFFLPHGIPLLFLAGLCIYACPVLAARIAWRQAPSGRGVRRPLLTLAGLLLAVSLAVHLSAGLVTGRQLDLALRRARAAGLPTTLAEIIPPALPEAENAATLYRPAFEAAEALEKILRADWDDLPFVGYEPADELAGAHLTAAADLLAGEEFATLYALTDAAAALPYCRFDVAWEDGYYVPPLPHLSQLRCLARLVALRTHVLARLGDYPAALASARTGFRLPAALDREPMLVSHIVRFSLAETAADGCRPLLEAAPGDAPAAVYRELLGETARIERSIVPGIHGNLVIRADPWAAIFSSLSEFGKPIRRFYPRRWVLPPLCAPAWRRQRTVFTRDTLAFTRFAEQPWFSARTEVLARGNRPLRPCEIHPSLFFNVLMQLATGGHFSVGGITEPWYRFYLERRAQSLASLDAFRLALALRAYREEHGHSPDTLADLAPGILPDIPPDPFTGKDFIYRPDGAGFTVYSVGPNLADDGGRRDLPRTDDIGWSISPAR